MRPTFDSVCGCFPTGRHYPGIAERIARAIVAVEGLASEWSAQDEWVAQPIAIVDFETTGVDAQTDRIIEVGVVSFVGGEVKEKRQMLINPGILIPADSIAVHGITNEDVLDAPSFGEVAAEIAGMLAGAIPAAYNASFDRGFLHAEFERNGAMMADPPPALRSDVVWVDPLVWVRELMSEMKSKKLGAVCEELGVELDDAHRADADAEATGHVLFKLAERMPKTYGELIRLQSRYAARQDAEMAAWRRS